ncbi:MAG: VIT1/CCC1 transporter family protein [Chloroflexota bacterium]
MRYGHELHPHRGSWLREVVFGLNDGLVTTLVFVLAISAVAHPQIVVIALGELFAGGVSMGLGGYLSARTERAILRQRIATERYEITHEPDEERSELRRIYQAKGFRGPLLDRLIRHLTADNERWLEAMIRDELGVTRENAERPQWLQGVLIGGSFMVGAFVPILPFLLSLSLPWLWAYGLTVVAAIALGVVEARYTLQGPLGNALEFLGIVTLGALGGLAISTLLRLIAGG